MKGTISRRIAVGVASLAVAAGTIATVGASSAAGVAPGSDDVQVLSTRQVIADSLTLWNAPSGGSGVGTWHWPRCFTVISGPEGDNRYRTHTESGAHVWVSADPRWTAPGCV